MRGLSGLTGCGFSWQALCLLWFWVTLGSPAFQSASAYYLTVSELTAKGTDAYDKNLRVNGTLVPTSFERDSGGTLMHFSLTDGQDTINAVHDGVVPDLFFNEHSEILLEGTYGPEGSVRCRGHHSQVPVQVSGPGRYGVAHAASDNDKEKRPSVRGASVLPVRAYRRFVYMAKAPTWSSRLLALTFWVIICTRCSIGSGFSCW